MSSVKRASLIAQLEHEGYEKIFERGAWVYYQKGGSLYCLEQDRYEKRTIVDGGRSPSEIEYFENS